MPSGSQIAHSTLWPQGVNLLLEYLFYAQPGLCSGEPRGADGGPAPHTLTRPYFLKTS
jgi:hypothetical protein